VVYQKAFQLKPISMNPIPHTLPSHLPLVSQ